MTDNILFISVDQWRGDCLSALGHFVQTPHLDAFAQDAVMFTQHYANAVPCGPSRTSMHTGMYLQNHRSGTNGTPLDGRHTNWAREIRTAGFDPVLFGYTDTAPDPRGLAPLDPRLQSYEGVLDGITQLAKMGEHPTAWVHWLRGKGYEVPDPSWRFYTTKKEGAVEWEDGGEHPAPLALPRELHDTWFMTDEVMHYIGGASAPWCVHLSLTRPHPPWHAPEPYNRMYPPAELPDPIAAPEGEDVHPYLANVLASHAAAPDEPRRRRLTSSYLGLISEVDDNLGRLFAFLKERGDWDNTLIVFTSDHGEQLGDHGLMGKLGFFDASYHVPMIVRVPGGAARGARVEAFTEHVDIMPTLLEWLGLELPAQCDGRSLLPFMAEGSAPDGWREAAHWEYDFRDIEHPERLQNALGLVPSECTLNVLRSETGKYVHFAGLPPIFFDLTDDPDETRNRANDPACAQAVLEHAQALLSWRMRHDEHLLTHLRVTSGGVKAGTQGI